ncbi:E3 SUMO-protein ligase RanBP2-like [Fopius arisanus]|uniref:E3 SUMO-protein ligase RanBP2-like n=1 Tax=Fopius arisanus TaxID=64838 RepID=A0A9R1TP67_9HYME|nr:PREDICTED: E3 SUMO-protein ligase RanBP2-like [Fopius arisanus]
MVIACAAQDEGVGREVEVETRFRASGNLKDKKKKRKEVGPLGKSSVKSPGTDDSEDEVPEREDVYLAPVIPLREKIEVKTVEENEEILYTHRAKLFRFDEKTLKLCLNHLVPDDMELTAKDDKSCVWNAADYSDNKIEYVQLACRFKTPDIAEQFKISVEEAIVYDSGSKEEIQRTSKSCSVGSGQDIQVV